MEELLDKIYIKLFNPISTIHTQLTKYDVKRLRHTQKTDKMKQKQVHFLTFS